MPQYTIQVIKVGQADVPGPEVYWMSHWTRWETLYFYIFLIRGEGKTIIVNTGAAKDLTDQNNTWKEIFNDDRAMMKRSEDEQTQMALAKHGVKLNQVDVVLITPLQSYVTSNITLFPHATICLSKRGWIEDFHAPRYPLHVPRDARIPKDVLMYLETEANDRLRLLEDEDEVVPGIRAFWSGVHHRSSMAYCIDTPQGTTVITDSIFKYPNIEQGLALGIQESMMEYHQTCARIKKEAQIVLPLYEPEILKRFPGGLIG